MGVASASCCVSDAFITHDDRPSVSSVSIRHGAKRRGGLYFVSFRDIRTFSIFFRKIHPQNFTLLALLQVKIAAKDVSTQSDVLENSLLIWSVNFHPVFPALACPSLATCSAGATAVNHMPREVDIRASGLPPPLLSSF